jgi:hypothetical protein
VSASGPSTPTGIGDQLLRLSFPEEGLRFDELVLRLPNAEDLHGLAGAFAEGELSEPDNISPFRRDELAMELAEFVANGEPARLVVADLHSGMIFGGGTLSPS